MSILSMQHATPAKGRRINKDGANAEVLASLALMGLGNTGSGLTMFGYGTSTEMESGQAYKADDIDLGDGESANPDETIGARVRRTYKKGRLLIVTLGIDDVELESEQIAAYIAEHGIGALEDGQTFNIDAVRSKHEVKVQFFEENNGQLTDVTAKAMQRLGLTTVTAIAQDRGTKTLYIAGNGTEGRPVILKVDERSIARFGAAFTLEDATEVTSLEAFQGKVVALIEMQNGSVSFVCSEDGIRGFDQASMTEVEYFELAWNPGAQELLAVSGNTDSGAVVDAIDVLTGLKLEQRFDLPAGTQLVAVTRNGQPVIATTGGYAWGFLQ